MAESRIPSIHDFADAEHCVLEDVTVRHAAIDPESITASAEPRNVRDEVEIRDPVRGRTTLVRIFEEGWADIEVVRRGNRQTHHRIDLRYLDAAPTIERFYPFKLLKATGIAAGVTALVAIPALVGWFSAYTVPAALVASGITATAGFIAFYTSHEKITFQTLHGRAETIRFGAGLGTIRRFRKLVPKLVEAIGDSAESVTDDTAIYLRSEMREHYRLRSDGVLTEQECADSTGRILANFDVPR
jgi:hypothetical protein